MSRSFIAHNSQGDRLKFRSMTGQERISHLFEYRVRLIGDTPGIAAKSMLGEDLSVEVNLATELGGSGQRFISGQVTQFSYVGKDDGDKHVYEAVMRPWLWYATRRSDFKIFQFKTVPQILHEVLGPYGFSVEDKFSGSYRTWDYCVQYAETDFNFVSRLMELEGLYYHFEHAQGSHKMLLCDGMASHVALPNGPSKVPYHAGVLAAQILEQDFIDTWSHTEDIAPGHYATDDYDFKKPNAQIDALRQQPAGHSQDSYEMYDWPGGYTEQGDGENYARVRMEQQGARRELIDGQGNLRHLAPGFLFDLSRHPNADENKRYLIEAVTCDFQENALRQVAGAGAAYAEGTSGTSYRQTFQVLPDSALYRTARVTPKPRTTGPQTAVVVGPAGEEIYTDQYGRIKVQFHWDRYGKMDENSSCWIRVSHTWAGSGYGAVHIPRIGQEVIVDFLNGDPDYPIVTGCVYNAAQMPPWELPRHKTQSGTQTHWSKGGGGKHMLRFEDNKGTEHIELSTDHGNTHLHMGYLMNQGTEAQRSYGFELRTNEWGSIRADKGLLLTTYTSDFTQKLSRENPDGHQQLGDMLQHTDGMVQQAEQAVTQTKAMLGALKDARSQSLGPMLSAIVGPAAGSGAAETGMPQSGDPAMAESKELLANSKQVDKPIVSIVSPEGQSIISPKPVVVSSGQSVSIHAKSNVTVSSGAQITHLAKSGTFTHVNTGGAITVVSSGDIAHTASTGALNLVSMLNSSMTSTAGDANVEGKNNVLIKAETTGVKITAPRRIELICGPTKIVMDGDAGTITLEAPNRISTESTSADLRMKAKTQIAALSDGKGILDFKDTLEHHGSEIHLNPNKG